MVYHSVSQSYAQSSFKYSFRCYLVPFSLALYGGRFILLRWFEEAWQQNRYNNLLINRLDALAHRDPLTGVANRRALDSILGDAVEQEASFALIMLDVDF